MSSFGHHPMLALAKTSRFLRVLDYDRVEKLLSVALFSMTNSSTLHREFVLACIQIFSFCRYAVENFHFRTFEDIKKSIPAMLYFVLNRFSCFLELLVNFKILTFSRFQYRWAFVMLIEFAKLALAGIHNKEFLMRVLQGLTSVLQRFSQRIRAVLSRNQVCLDSADTGEGDVSAKPIETIQIGEKQYIVPRVCYITEEKKISSKDKPLSDEEVQYASLDLLSAFRPMIMASLSFSLDAWKNSISYSKLSESALEHLQAPKVNSPAKNILISAFTTLDGGLSWAPWIARMSYDYFLYSAARGLQKKMEKQIILHQGVHRCDELSSDSNSNVTDKSPHPMIAEDCGMPVAVVLHNSEAHQKMQTRLRRNVLSAAWADPFYSSFGVKSLVKTCFIEGGIARVPFVGSILREIFVHFHDMRESSWLFTL